MKNVAMCSCVLALLTAGLTGPGFCNEDEMAKLINKYKKLKLTIKVSVHKDRSKGGKLWIQDQNGAVIGGPWNCLAQADAKLADDIYKNKDRDTTKKGGHTPTGGFELWGYKKKPGATLERFKNNESKRLKSYGPHGGLVLDGISGDAKTAYSVGGRSGILIHGGDLSKSTGGLRPTLGCIRMSNGDFKSLLKTMVTKVSEHQTAPACYIDNDFPSVQLTDDMQAGGRAYEGIADSFQIESEDLIFWDLLEPEDLEKQFSPVFTKVEIEEFSQLVAKGWENRRQAKIEFKRLIAAGADAFLYGKRTDGLLWWRNEDYWRLVEIAKAWDVLDELPVTPEEQREKEKRDAQKEAEGKKRLEELPRGWNGGFPDLWPKKRNVGSGPANDPKRQSRAKDREMRPDLREFRPDHSNNQLEGPIEGVVVEKREKPEPPSRPERITGPILESAP